MLILTLRTDKPEAELGLYRDDTLVKCISWQAHRQLAETLHGKIDELLRDEDPESIDGYVFYKGPGSFTGLRIGASVMDALAYSFSKPIVGFSGENWHQQGIEAIRSGKNHKVISLEYGAPVHITKQKK